MLEGGGGGGFFCGFPKGGHTKLAIYRIIPVKGRGGGCGVCYYWSNKKISPETQEFRIFIILLCILSSLITKYCCFTNNVFFNSPISDISSLSFAVNLPLVLIF